MQPNILLQTHITNFLLDFSLWMYPPCLQLSISKREMVALPVLWAGWGRGPGTSVYTFIRLNYVDRCQRAGRVSGGSACAREECQCAEGGRGTHLQAPTRESGDAAAVRGFN